VRGRYRGKRKGKGWAAPVSARRTKGEGEAARGGEGARGSGQPARQGGGAAPGGGRRP
jgi:hypothetical protein